MGDYFKTLTVTQAKKSLLDIVEGIEKMRERVTITRNGIPTTILMGVDDYESLMETLEILSNPKIMQSLRKSRKQRLQKRLLDDAEVWK